MKKQPFILLMILGCLTAPLFAQGVLDQPDQVLA